MEFLRFGSRIPGTYWGCCAADIIQNFKMDPDTPSSIELVGGDGGNPIYFPSTDPKKRTGAMFAGKTYGDIFRQRLRYGTHYAPKDMPNHTFFAILTDSQISGDIGKKWLKLLKEEGFEFLRTVDNSVYTGDSTTGKGRSPHKNHIFAMFRNISNSRVEDPFTPPKAWTDLPDVVSEGWRSVKDGAALAKEQTEAHLKLYDALPKGEFYTREELEKEGVPVYLAGRRSENMQELAKNREQREANKKDKAAPTPAPFKKAPAAAA